MLEVWAFCARERASHFPLKITVLAFLVKKSKMKLFGVWFFLNYAKKKKLKFRPVSRLRPEIQRFLMNARIIWWKPVSSLLEIEPSLLSLLCSRGIGKHCFGSFEIHCFRENCVDINIWIILKRKETKGDINHHFTFFFLPQNQTGSRLLKCRILRQSLTSYNTGVYR